MGRVSLSQLLPPVECPNCRQGITRMRLFWRTAWSRWRCPGCGALLGTDTKRRLLAIGPWIAIMFILLFVFRAANLGAPFVLPVLLGAAIVNFALFDRIVLHERTGFRCRRCGYDLTGQSDDRCPECGETFDPSARDAPAATPSLATDAALRRRRIVIALIIARRSAVPSSREGAAPVR